MQYSEYILLGLFWVSIIAVVMFMRNTLKKDIADEREKDL